MLIRGVKIQEKIDRFREIGIEAILESNELEAEFAQFYKTLYGVKICVGCSAKMRQKFNDLMKTNPDKIRVMSKRQFTMIPGKLIDRTMASKAPFGMFNADSITDEDAIALLRASRGYIKYFKEFPKNWRELLTGKPKSVKKPDASVDAPADVPETSTDTTDATEDRTEAIEAEGKIKGKTSGDFNATEAVGLIESLDNAKLVESFTDGCTDEPKKRKTVKKAARKRVRQLSE